MRIDAMMTLCDSKIGLRKLAAEMSEIYKKERLTKIQRDTVTLIALGN